MQSSKAPNSGSKSLIVIGVVVVLIALGYYFYTSGQQTATDATSGGSNSSFDVAGNPTADGETGLAVGADVYSLLNQIQSLNIDPNFFTKTIYMSLVDFTIDIPPENVGRANPFAPFSGAGSAQSRDAAAAARALQR